MRGRFRQRFACALAVLLLLAGGLLLAQCTRHLGHKASHQARGHSSTVCVWLCATAQAMVAAGAPVVKPVLVQHPSEAASPRQAACPAQPGGDARGPPLLRRTDPTHLG